ncbi:sugar nucleotide-binding protein [Novosphingobium sp. KACC 22771]|uniref:sugar nucleotide-binding protein n=1 Tax=Novosphingobium sp. KACC 22771 TaxID=3025670 RepID=UPI0023664697|nr:sugar nucleotide-binding protein [Novosphingobium sp. KACC 22771]WDF72869.1 sugar nucleotide-binding protein [Novosphingobium sp. KACC 22771]
MRTALVGYTGFVGSTLTRARGFDDMFNSRNIGDIAGQSYDMVVCAAAPATMWAANQNPAADKANLDGLFAALRLAKTEHFVLISTIAVLDNAAAGYTEANAAFESEKAYGLHRRELEERVESHFANSHILRLPALFGPGIKKNFVFDLMNPAPSFIKPDVWEKTLANLSAEDAALLGRYYALDEGLGMWGLNRVALNGSQDRENVNAIFHQINFVARNFTNSETRFQYYNMERLADNIDQAVAAGIDTLNVCSQPLSAAEVCRELTGDTFVNTAPPLWVEDMRSIHAETFGGSGPYLFDRESVLGDLKAFFAAEAGR